MARATTSGLRLASCIRVMFHPDYTLAPAYGRVLRIYYIMLPDLALRQFGGYMLNRLHESQFFTGMAYGLQRRGYTMSPSHDKTSNGELALHLSMEDAACHLLHMAESGELDVDVRFRLGRN